jgi:superfamily II helicase
MNESISENTLRRRRSILTVLAVYKQLELLRLINTLNLVHNLSHEEVVRELRFMESEGLVRISGDIVALTGKGVEVVKEVGVDENLAKNTMEQLLVVAKPFLVTLALLKPELGRLDVWLPDAETLKKTIYVFTPPKPPYIILELKSLTLQYLCTKT